MKYWAILKNKKKLKIKQGDICLIKECPIACKVDMLDFLVSNNQSICITEHIKNLKYKRHIEIHLGTLIYWILSVSLRNSTTLITLQGDP